ncbi:hypothetical protein C8R47DRAFT_1330077 [Mycena vitilis]|nr:hypothetical protein C8R47DRAFT_1330077 [Mycena vitilis]
MTSQDRVPNELWAEIAKNLPEYDRKILVDFFLTCRTFRSVSRPRLFAKFSAEVYPCFLLHPRESIGVWSASASGRPQNAPFVRSCCISTKDVPRYEKDSSEWISTTETPYILLDAVLERLTRFTCLQQLEARDLHFTQARAAILSRLPHLSKLSVRAYPPHVSFIDDMFKGDTEIYNFKKSGKDVLVHGRFGHALRTGFKPSTFFITLPGMPVLPPKLERLAISWECYALEDVEELCAFKVPMVRDTVRAQCPGIKWLYLHGFYFMLEWRDSDGKVSERTAKNFMDGYEKSPEIFGDVDFML